MKVKILTSCICLLLLLNILPGFISGQEQCKNSNFLHCGVNTSYDLLVVAPRIFVDLLVPLREHKDQFGINTKIVSLSDIYDGSYFAVSGRDEAEKIKYFIKNALDEWNITYVLLVGGRKPGVEEEWYCPVRYINEELWGDPYLSDLYFADIYNNQVFQSWDSNNDDLFGTSIDEMDLYPDVFVGRWACRSLCDVKTVVEKTLRYENYIDHSKKVVLVGGDIFDDSEGFLEGELIPERTATYLDGYEPIRVYASQNEVSAHNIKKALDKGASFLHMDGHCWMTYLSVYKPNNFDQFEAGIGIWNIPFLSNEEYPIAVVGGCRTAQFNVAVFNRPEQTLESPLLAKYFPAFHTLSWGLVREPNGGSIASIGYTIPPFFGDGEHGDMDDDGVDEPDILEIGMGMLEPTVFYAFRVEGKEHLGGCWGYSLSTYIDKFGDLGGVWNTWNTATIHGFVLLGDPSLKIGGYSV